jgi:hypothetical protein
MEQTRLEDYELIERNQTVYFLVGGEIENFIVTSWDRSFLESKPKYFLDEHIFWVLFSRFLQKGTLKAIVQYILEGDKRFEGEYIHPLILSITASYVEFTDCISTWSDPEHNNEICSKRIFLFRWHVLCRTPYREYLLKVVDKNSCLTLMKEKEAIEHFEQNLQDKCACIIRKHSLDILCLPPFIRTRFGFRRRSKRLHAKSSLLSVANKRIK